MSCYDIIVFISHTFDSLTHASYINM